MTLGEQIKQKREEQNLTQEDLAERLGVSRQAVSKWESGLSLPQGSNRAALGELLSLDIPGPQPQKSFRGLCIAGWSAAAVLLLALVCTQLLFHPQPGDSSAISGLSGSGESSSISSGPALEGVRFYDKNQEEVTDEALWYNANAIDSILIDWNSGSPGQIQMFYTPSGSETAEQTELLLTKSILDGDSSALLSAAPLHREDLHGHLYFQLSFGDTVLTSDLYNLVFDLEL